VVGKRRSFLPNERLPQIKLSLMEMPLRLRPSIPKDKEGAPEDLE